MTDIVGRETRSRMMSSIKGKNTKPEVQIGKALHKLGLRYRKHYSKLPGKPDLVFPRYKAIVLVNGCFWHGHECHLFKWPSTSKKFWKKKISDTQERDAKNFKVYRSDGWRTFVLWECAVKSPNAISYDEAALNIRKWILDGVNDAELVGENVQQDND